MPDESQLDSVTPSENPGRGIESTEEEERFSKPDRRSPSERDSGGDSGGDPMGGGSSPSGGSDPVSEATLDEQQPSENPGRGIESTEPASGIPDRDGPPPDSGEEGDRLDDVQDSPNPGIDSPTQMEEEEQFSKPDRRGPSERQRQLQFSRQTPGVQQEDIRETEVIDTEEGQVIRAELTEQAAEERAREQFEDRRRRAREEADVDDPTVSQLGAFESDELQFEQRDDGQFVVQPTEAAVEERQQEVVEQRAEAETIEMDEEAAARRGRTLEEAGGGSTASTDADSGLGTIADARVPGTNTSVLGALDQGSEAFQERVVDPLAEGARDIGEADTMLGAGGISVEGSQQRGQLFEDFTRTAGQSVNVPGFAAGALRLGPRAARLEGDPEAAQQAAEVGIDLGQESAEFVRENPARAGAVVAGGFAGAGVATGASRAARAGARRVTDVDVPTPSQPTSGAGLTRRARRDISDLEVELTRDPDSGPVDINLGASREVNLLDDIPLGNPLQATTRRAELAGRRAARSLDETITDARFTASEAVGTVRNAPRAARQRAELAGRRVARDLDETITDARFTASEAVGTVRNAPRAARQRAELAGRRAARDLDETITDARFTAARARQQPSELATNVEGTLREFGSSSFVADTRTRRTRPLGLADRFNRPSGFESSFLSDTATGRTRPLLGTAGATDDALSTLSGARGRARDLIDTEESFLSDTRTARARPFLSSAGAVDDATPSMPSAPRSLDDLGIGGEGGLRDLTLRISSREGRQTVDVEDLVGPDPAEGAPVFRNRPFEADPDAPSGAGSRGQIESEVDVGGGQVARLRQRQGDTGPRSLARSRDPPEPTAQAGRDDVVPPLLGAAEDASLDSGSFLGNDTETGPSVGTDLDVGTDIGPMTAEGSDLGLDVRAESRTMADQTSGQVGDQLLTQRTTTARTGRTAQRATQTAPSDAPRPRSPIEVPEFGGDESDANVNDRTPRARRLRRDLLNPFTGE